MYNRLVINSLLAFPLMISAVQAYRPGSNDEMILANSMPRSDAIEIRYLNVVEDIRQSKNFVQCASKISCDVPQSLENDTGRREDFVKDIEQGRIPKIIKDMCPEIVNAFTDLRHIVEELPTDVLDTTQATVTNAVKLFESGSTISKIEQILAELVSEIMNYAHRLRNAIKNFILTTTFEALTPNPPTQIGFTDGLVIYRSSNPVPTTTFELQMPNLSTRIGSSSLESKLVQMCAFRLLTVFLVAISL